MLHNNGVKPSAGRNRSRCDRWQDEPNCHRLDLWVSMEPERGRTGLGVSRLLGE
ncbi:hypothetical protein NG791_17550 [Laspinema sp. D1]|uniref:hypothetical protein n=1 Tax=Laspinema palackyanum TaxID=3231601 RepID=UPI00349A61DA|nr:hypothetical protein [Laspinema sp. D2b]